MRYDREMLKVVWLKPVLGRYGKTVQRIEATLMAVGEDWCTVELLDGQRCAAKIKQVKLLKTAGS